jgi:hypothetical protein
MLPCCLKSCHVYHFIEIKVFCYWFPELISSGFVFYCIVYHCLLLLKRESINPKKKQEKRRFILQKVQRNPWCRDHNYVPYVEHNVKSSKYTKHHILFYVLQTNLHLLILTPKWVKEITRLRKKKKISKE